MAESWVCRDTETRPELDSPPNRKTPRLTDLSGSDEDTDFPSVKEIIESHEQSVIDSIPKR